MSELDAGDIRPRVQYVGDGATDSFLFDFPLLRAEDLTVALDDSETLDFTLVSYGPTGGEVRFAVPPAAQTRVSLFRDAAIDQYAAFLDSQPLQASAVNAAFDRLTLLAQELDALARDAVRKRPHDSDVDLSLPSATDRAGRVLYFDSEGRPQPQAAAADAESSIADTLAQAEAARDAAQQAATSVNLPQIQSGDAGKHLSVKGDLSGYEFLVPFDGTWASLSGSPAIMSQAEAEAGAATTERTVTAQRIAQAISAQAAAVELLDEQTVGSAVNAVELTGFSDGYRDYLVTLAGVSADTTGQYVVLRAAVGGGTLITGSNYAYTFNATNNITGPATIGAGNAATGIFVVEDYTLDTNSQLGGFLHIQGARDAFHSVFNGSFNHRQGNANISAWVQGRLIDSGALSKLQFYVANASKVAGNYFGAGIFRLYGVKHVS